MKFGLDSSRVPDVVAASKEPIVRFFSYHDAHPVALGLVLMKAFGETEWLGWEAPVLRSEIIDHFKATSISPNNWSKIEAFRALMLVESPWTDWHIFEKVVLSLNNSPPEQDVVQTCTVAQLFAGVDIINSIREEKFDPEVCAYMATCALEEGVTWLPTPLECALDRLQEKMYRCKDCGAEARYDETTKKDDRCDFCCERFRDGKEFDGKPNPKLDKSCGTNIEVFMKRPPGGIPARFQELKDKEEADLDQGGPEDLQAGKLVVAHKYMLLRREQLVEQLEELEKWVAK